MFVKYHVENYEMMPGENRGWWAKHFDTVSLSCPATPVASSSFASSSSRSLEPTSRTLSRRDLKSVTKEKKQTAKSAQAKGRFLQHYRQPRNDKSGKGRNFRFHLFIKTKQQSSRTSKVLYRKGKPTTRSVPRESPPKTNEVETEGILGTVCLERVATKLVYDRGVSSQLSVSITCGDGSSPGVPANNLITVGRRAAENARVSELHGYQRWHV